MEPITDEEIAKLKEDLDTCPRCGEKLDRVAGYFDHRICSPVVVLECTNPKCNFKIKASE